MTWHEWRSRSEELGAGWLRCGLKKGERVAVILPGTNLWKVVELSILMAGGVTVPISPRASEHRVARIFEETRPRFAVTAWPARLAESFGGRFSGEEPAYVERVYYVGERSAEPARRSPGLPKGGEGGGDAEPFSDAGLGALIGKWWQERYDRIDTLVSMGRTQLELDPSAVERAGSTLGEDDLSTIIFTPGTSGESKGVVLDHGNMLAECVALQERLRLAADRSQLLLLPPWHVLGLTASWMGVTRGLRTGLSFSDATVLRELASVRPHFIMGIPGTFERLLELAGRPSENLAEPARKIWDWARSKVEASSRRRRLGIFQRLPVEVAAGVLRRHLKRMLGGRVECLVCVGAPPSGCLERIYRDAGLPLLHGYGLTETCGLTHLNPRGREKVGTVGLPLEGIEAKLAPDGEIFVRSRTTFRGYWGRGDESWERAVSREGWFATGDLGLVEDGYLRLVGRKRDIMRTAGGKPVAPLAIEAALGSLQGIRRALVVGHRRPFVTALVDVDPVGLWAACGRAGPPPKQWRCEEDDEAAEEVRREIATVNRDLPSHERVTEFRIVAGGLTEERGEVGPTGQPLRSVILSRYASVVEEMYGRGERKRDDASG
jgi:long-chain acyl-CoA synthetase